MTLLGSFFPELDNSDSFCLDRFESALTGLNRGEKARKDRWGEHEP
jgi:hypothetical protein